MAFPLRGVELISLVSKICHYDVNCPSCTQKCWKQSQSLDLFIYFLLFFFLLGQQHSQAETFELTCLIFSEITILPLYLLSQIDFL